MTWNDVTVFQWQQLMNLYVKEDVADLETATLSILFNRTENEILSLSEGERLGLLSKIDFVHTPPQGKPEKSIKCQSGARYKCIYDVRQLRAALADRAAGDVEQLLGDGLGQDDHGLLLEVADHADHMDEPRG